LFAFLELIEKLERDTAALELSEKVQFVIEHSGLMTFYAQDKVEKSADKIENLKELINAAAAFSFENVEEEGLSELAAFLSHAALESGESQADEFDDCVQLMTLHTAKGLEFPLVFLVGVEEGIFPSQQSIYDKAKLEEERRLCYVGITRAMQKLHITYADNRLLYGKSTAASKSRFLKELPQELLEEVRPKRDVSRPVTAKTPNFLAFKAESDSRYKMGQRVHHETFGSGVIQTIEGEGAKERILIKFNRESRWLMTAYTELTVVN
ncbi:MAG: 3'-5' exonuclease, partial [Methylococcales bacterium]|nr:3'-5' exonuclease [Methylococcales bacterium]